MKATGTIVRPSQQQNTSKQVSSTNILIKSLKNISSDQSTEDDDTMNHSSKITATGSTASIPRNNKQNSVDDRSSQYQQSQLTYSQIHSNNASIRSLSTGQLQSLQKAKAKINQYQKSSINPSFASIHNLDQQQQKSYSPVKKVKVSSSSYILTEDQTLNEGEDEDHTIWDDDLLKVRGIDTDNWLDTDGKPFTLFHLYKARFGTHPNQREEISNEEVVKMMKRFSRNRRNKNLERFPWETFTDKRSYCDESDLYYDRNFQIFHKLFNTFYNADKARHTRQMMKNNFIQKIQMERNGHIPSIEDEITQPKNSDENSTQNSFLLKKNIRSMSQVGSINHHQSQINSGLNSFRIRQVQNNPTQQQPLNSYLAKSQNLIASNDNNQMISHHMLASKDQSPVKQSPISLQSSYSQVQANSPFIGASPLKKVISQTSNNSESAHQSPVKKYHNQQSSIDQQTFSAMMESAQSTATKSSQSSQQSQPSFKYQLISALKNPVQQQNEDSYQNYLNQKIKIIQNQKLREHATQITQNQSETRKQSLLKRQSSVNNSASKYSSVINTSQVQLTNINLSKQYSTNDSMMKNANNTSSMQESFSSPTKKGSYSPIKGRNTVNQATVGNLLHLRNINTHTHQPSPFNDLNSVKKMNILTLMK